MISHHVIRYASSGGNFGGVGGQLSPPPPLVELIKLTGPKIKLTGPKIKLTGPKIKLTGPKIKLTGPKIKLTGPKIKLTGPKIKLTGPKIKLTSPNRARNLQYPDIHMISDFNFGY